MANLNETPNWEDGIYQWETSDPVMGGPNGIDNKPTRQLANRTLYLKNKLDNLPAASKDQAGIIKVIDDLTTDDKDSALSAAQGKVLNENKLDKKDTATTAEKLKTARKVGGVDFDGSADVYLPVSAGYDPSQQYAPGDLVKVDGIWYECYHPAGCLGKDPRDAKNRPAGWTDTNEANPYFWLKIGQWLSLPEPGSPIYLPSVTLREGLIKYRNDGALHKSKFWRLAQLYPDLISGNYIQIADLRGEFLRGLDDGRGIDLNRVINSLQGDAIRNITGAVSAANGFVVDNFSGAFFDSGARSANMSNQTHQVNANDDFCFDASRVVPTANENRPINIAMLIATRI